MGGAEFSCDFSGVWGVVDRLQVFGKGFTIFIGHILQRVPDLMDDAALFQSGLSANSVRTERSFRVRGVTVPLFASFAAVNPCQSAMVSSDVPSHKYLRT